MGMWLCGYVVWPSGYSALCAPRPLGGRRPMSRSHIGQDDQENLPYGSKNEDDHDNVRMTVTMGRIMAHDLRLRGSRSGPP